MKRIVYQRPDGGVSIVAPAPWARLCRSILGPDGVRLSFDPPVAFHQVAHTQDAAAMVRLAPEWAETEDEFVKRAAWPAVPGDATSVSVVDESAIPADRTFREAWRPDLSCDMTKARDIWRDRMRQTRAPKLAALDVDYQRADESGDATRKADVAKRKQALRDVTKHPDIEAAQSPETLKAVWPRELA